MWIKDLFAASGLSKADFARRAGVSRQHLNWLLRDGNGPSLKTAQAIAKRLGQPLTDTKEAQNAIEPPL